ncbi:hypothetical protein [Nocardioides luteus]|uniref:hypothetical protein n=1 Tax=Nocardioides luteus TaxID=1844 RepID=UPI001A26F253|nr:hypothetical protein [Nocardioides luteus]MBG6099081.1 hypothetical protein [Nocardioides luteus]
MSFVRAGAIVAGVTLAGLSAAPAFATGGSDPAGNNGTVKIEEYLAPDDAPDTTPNNDPHQDCKFDIEWYGFDKGDDIISKVSFELQAPTVDGELTVDGDLEVFVGEDDASGAGTEEGLDGRETYVLHSTGVPHPEQGFHVKVTVHTPGSQGNDTKSKVFWFENCGGDTNTTSPTPTPSPSEPVESESPSEEPSEEPSESPSESTPASDETEPASDESSEAPVTDSEVPTNIDAGLAGESDSPVPAMWPLLAMLAGAAAAGTALVVVLRRRAAALVHKD